MSAELVQTVRLYCPIAHTEQLVHAVDPASAKVPEAHAVQAEGLVMPVPVENRPATHALQFGVPSPRQPPVVPAGHGFGQARMIMGVVVSPRKAYSARTSVPFRVL